MMDESVENNDKIITFAPLISDAYKINTTSRKKGLHIFYSKQKLVHLSKKYQLPFLIPPQTCDPVGDIFIAFSGMLTVTSHVCKYSNRDLLSTSITGFVTGLKNILCIICFYPGTPFPCPTVLFILIQFHLTTGFVIPRRLPQSLIFNSFQFLKYFDINQFLLSFIILESRRFLR